MENYGRDVIEESILLNDFIYFFLLFHLLLYLINYKYIQIINLIKTIKLTRITSTYQSHPHLSLCQER